MIAARVKADYRFPVFSTRYQDFVKDEDRLVIEENETQALYGEYLEFVEVEEVEESEETSDSDTTKDEILALTMPQLRTKAKQLGLALKSVMDKTDLQNLILDHLFPEE